MHYILPYPWLWNWRMKLKLQFPLQPNKKNANFVFELTYLASNIEKELMKITTLTSLRW
jgi:hypothetical protein